MGDSLILKWKTAVFPITVSLFIEVFAPLTKNF
jgi:hypothetical protein